MLSPPVPSSFDLATIADRLRRRHPAHLRAGAEGGRAAVAAILRGRSSDPSPGPGDGRSLELLFIRRAEHPLDPWSGHMAFPGGRSEPGDRTPADTAIRETREEIGLDLAAHGTLLARLPDLPAVARGKRLGLTITPFVFAVDGAPPVTPNDEVAEVVWAPLGPLTHERAIVPYRYVHEGTPLLLPSVRVGERVVWGLTFQMLRTLLDAIADDLMPSAQIE